MKIKANQFFMVGDRVKVVCHGVAEIMTTTIMEFIARDSQNPHNTDCCVLVCVDRPAIGKLYKSEYRSFHPDYVTLLGNDDKPLEYEKPDWMP